MIDMELEDNLKLKVATRLMDNLKLRTFISITWELFVQDFND